MRPVDAATIKALRGSRSGDEVTAYVWYGGSLAYPNKLPISNVSFDWDIDRQIQSFSCKVTDKDGKLAPWLLEDPLGVGGSRLHVRYEVGSGSGGVIPMGVYRIGRSRPKERWHSYIINETGRVNLRSQIPNDKKLRFVSGGSSIDLTCYDLGDVIKQDELVAPESPPTGATVISEIKRLLQDICPVTVASGVIDRAVSRFLIYERDRMDAVQDLCKRIGCAYRFSGSGVLEVYPVLQEDPVVVLEGGPGGLLVDVDRSQDKTGLKNRFIVDGKRESVGPDGQMIAIPVRSIVDITQGALATSGPHGRDVARYSSPMIASQQDADEYALLMRDTQIAGLTTDLIVTCLPLPYLQQGDWVQVGNPVVNGEVLRLIGKVKTMSMNFPGTAPDRMTLTVQCSYSDVQAIIGAAR